LHWQQAGPLKIHVPQTHGQLAERSKAPVLKTGKGKPFASSNLRTARHILIFHGCLSERLKEPGCKPGALRGRGGSNPSASTMFSRCWRERRIDSPAVSSSSDPSRLSSVGRAPRYERGGRRFDSCKRVHSTMCRSMSDVSTILEAGGQVVNGWSSKPAQASSNLVARSTFFPRVLGSIGRALVSKTRGWGFEALSARHFFCRPGRSARRRVANPSRPVRFRRPTPFIGA
jgi:hypothetical protein